MNSTERFTPDCEPCHEFESWAGVMRDDPNGFYVRYTDYAALQQQLAAAREALRELQQACWDARAAMGFDNDGAPTPAALTYPTIPELILRDCREFRKEYDEACDENRNLERDASRYRWLRESGPDAPGRDPCAYRFIRGTPHPQPIGGTALDAAIDATLQRDRQP